MNNDCRYVACIGAVFAYECTCIMYIIRRYCILNTAQVALYKILMYVRMYRRTYVVISIHHLPCRLNVIPIFPPNQHVYPSTV